MQAHKNSEETKELIGAWVKLYDSLETYKWVVEIKDTKELIGSLDVVSKKFLPYGVCEIGYCYGEDFWSKGYGTECLKAVMKYLFEECDADVVCAEHLSQNPGSGKVMTKCGLKYEGTKRGRFVDTDGIRNDVLLYSITKEE